MDDGMVLLRRSQPCEFDIAPYGTQCKVLDHHDGYDLYLQVSHDEDDPYWEQLGTFSTKSHPDLLKELIEVRLRKHSHSD